MKKLYLLGLAPFFLAGCLGEGGASPETDNPDGHEAPSGLSTAGEYVPLGPDSGYASPESANQPGNAQFTHGQCIQICNDADVGRTLCESLCADIDYDDYGDNEYDETDYETYDESDFETEFDSNVETSVPEADLPPASGQ